jgi:hypothetical protein
VNNLKFNDQQYLEDKIRGLDKRVEREQYPFKNLSDMYNDFDADEMSDWEDLVSFIYED